MKIVTGPEGSGRTEELLLWLVEGHARHIKRALIVHTQAEAQALYKNLQKLWFEGGGDNEYLNNAANSIFCLHAWMNAGFNRNDYVEVAFADADVYLQKALRLDRPLSMGSVLDPTSLIQLDPKNSEAPTES